MIYRRQGTRTSRTGSGSANSGGSAEDCNYSSSTWSLSVTELIGYEYTRLYHGGIGYDADIGSSGSMSDGCPYFPIEEMQPVCSASGTSILEYFQTHCYGDGIEEVNKVNGRSYRYEHSLSSAEGETTEEYTAWQSIYTDDAGYESALNLYETYLDDYAQWETEWNAWNDGGQIGPEPEEPDAVDEPMAKPTQYYGKCWYKITTTVTIDPHYFGYNSDGSSPDDPDGEAFAEWIAGKAVGEPPCSGSGEFVSAYTQTPVSAMPDYGGSTTSSEEVYEEGVDKDGWIALVEGVMADAQFPHEGCMGELCTARKQILQNIDSGGNDISYAEQWFRYRIKLNKCCGYRNILSGWREIFFPQVYLDWLETIAGLGSSDDIPSAPVDPNDTATKKQWSWSGEPPLCPDGSSSASEDSSFEILDPYDHEPMWSPWSLVVKVPPGEQGIVAIRKYWQKCYGNLPDLMPTVMGDIDLGSDSEV